MNISMRLKDFYPKFYVNFSYEMQHMHSFLRSDTFSPSHKFTLVLRVSVRATDFSSTHGSAKSKLNQYNIIYILYLCIQLNERKLKVLRPINIPFSLALSNFSKRFILYRHLQNAEISQLLINTGEMVKIILVFQHFKSRWSYFLSS